MSRGIRLHPTLGLNPKLGLCLICKEENGEILLPGALVKKEYPRHMVSRNPCDRCKKLLDEGNTAFINTTNGDSCIIKEDAVRRMYGGNMYRGKIVSTKETFWKEAIK